MLATRPHRNGVPDFVNNYIAYGAGPRASQYLILGAKALAAMDGRLTPSIRDVQAMTLPVLRHRIIASFNAEADGVTIPELVEKLVEAVPVD